MGSIRYETHAASAYCVELLRYHQQIGRMLHNGIDIVLFETPAGAKVSLHFIASGLPLYEIRNTLTANAAQNIATQFWLWADMLLPYHGQTYRPDDWMEALHTLYGGAIYGYDVQDGAAQIFPVYFRGSGVIRQIEHGRDLPFAALTIRRVRTTLKDFVDTWLIADYGGTTGAAHDPQQTATVAAALADSYRLLEIPASADREVVKQAYRRLARRYHPDLSADPAAHDRMTALTAAYDRVLAALDGTVPPR